MSKSFKEWMENPMDEPEPEPIEVQCQGCEKRFVPDYEYDPAYEELKHYCGGAPWCRP